MGIKQRLTGDSDACVATTADHKIVLNVGGVRHETLISTLECVPGTRLSLLAHLQKADESYDPLNDEYFFDRHAKPFEAILHYYRTGELHVDQSICGNVMRIELEFWGLEESDIEPCCWAIYSKNTEHKQTLAELDENFAYANTQAWEEDSSLKLPEWRIKLWLFLEEPGSGRWAKVFAFVSMFFVALSILLFVLETHKLFQIDAKTGKPMMEVEPDDKWTPTGSPLSCCCEQEFNRTSANPETHPALLYLDYVCVTFFIVELILRFGVCPYKKKFFKDALNVIDLVCVIPYLVSIIMRTVEVESTGSLASVLKIVIMLRIVRILRIFKLMKHYSAFKILAYTLKVSTKELFLMVVFLMSGVLMFASLIHYIERDNFPNIPIAIWWALVTMTTVGYGDKYTVSMFGYVVGSMCVVCGVLVIAFTVPIVVNNFSLYYSHAQTRIKAPNKKKRREKSEKNIRKLILQKHKQLKSRKTDISFESLPPGSMTSRETSGLTTTDDEKQMIPSKESKYKRIIGNARSQVFKQAKPGAARTVSDSIRHGGGGGGGGAGVGTVSAAVARRERDGRNPRGGGVAGEESGGESVPVTAREIRVVDVESDDEAQTSRQEKLARETKKIMGDLTAQTERKKTERERQEILIRQRREKRRLRHGLDTPRSEAPDSARLSDHDKKSDT